MLVTDYTRMTILTGNGWEESTINVLNDNNV